MKRFLPALALVAAPALACETRDTFPIDHSEYDAVVDRICGPEGAISRDENGPVCARDGWDGKRYRDFCEGSRAFPRADDPWVQASIRDGNSLKDAQIVVSDNRTNGCD